ncbi:uncharacterized protein LOC142538998 [Primulina tabacum]|uniref:uncharacterized protein LOC142538998 n=1 Tax=Primulina tabacum TaxID=48773 RepID=UPI003F59877C
MASSPVEKFSLLLLFALLSYPRTQARDSQLFSKVSPDSITAVPNQEPPLNIDQQQESNYFQTENENGYGLESGQLPRSATGGAESGDHLHRHLPRNYNPVAYVTEPEEYTGNSNTYTENSYNHHLRNYYNNAQKSYDSQQEDEEMSEPEQYRYNNNYQYNRGGTFNSEPQGLRDARLSGRDGAHNSYENYYYNGGEESGFRPQGMSDTRSLENGKYFYDIKTEKYSNNHPYEILNRAGANSDYNERSYYGASENSMGESYQNQYEFQNEGRMP